MSRYKLKKNPCKTTTQNIQAFYKHVDDFILQTKCSHLVVGLSGGIDSTLVFYLLHNWCKHNKQKIKITGIFLPIYSSKLDYICVEQIKQQLAVDIEIINLEKEFLGFKSSFKKYYDMNPKIFTNIKSRLRMIALYTISNAINGHVVGTTNLCEWYLGYFTKFGDGAADFSPLKTFSKSDIYNMAHYFNLPEPIIKRKPSASLFENQSDEEDLGVSYTEIEMFLSGKHIPENKQDIIKKWHLKTNHKRK